jgi:hypothetical protein
VVPALAAVLGAAALIVMSSWPRSAAPAVPAPAPAIAATVPVAAIPRVLASPPVRVEIPAIGVRAEVMKLGIDSDGTLEVPPLSKADQTGWYERGAAPGTAGPTVIVGHVDTADGPAVFHRLGELRPGDRVPTAGSPRSSSTRWSRYARTPSPRSGSTATWRTRPSG